MTDQAFVFSDLLVRGHTDVEPLAYELGRRIMLVTAYLIGYEKTTLDPIGGPLSGVASRRATYCHDWGSSRYQSLTVSPGTHCFCIDGIWGVEVWTSWFVGGVWKEDDHSWWGNSYADPRFCWYFGSGTTKIDANNYDGDWNFMFWHTWDVTVQESVNSPSRPSGTSSGETGQNLSYSTGGSSSDLGHSVQYRFNWGDGHTSSWGSSSRSHSYSGPGTFCVKAQARCSTHTSVTSGWSSCRNVSIQRPRKGRITSVDPDSFSGSSRTVTVCVKNEGLDNNNLIVKWTSKPTGWSISPSSKQTRVSYNTTNCSYFTFTVTPPSADSSGPITWKLYYDDFGTNTLLYTYNQQVTNTVPRVTSLTWRSGTSSSSSTISSAQACDTVYARADAVNMSGQTITVKIRESDISLDPVVATRNITIGSSGFGTASWTALWECDKIGCLGGCPEYYIEYSGVSDSPNLDVCDTTPPSTPSLISPADGATISTSNVDFDWSNSTESSCGSGFDHYVLYVDDNASFSSPITRTTSSSSFSLNLGVDRWYWKVRAYDREDNYAQNGTRFFDRIDPGVTDLSWRSGTSSSSPVISSEQACQTVYARVNAVGMNGQTITVEIKERDISLDPVVATRSITIGSSGFGTASWIALWECDKFACLGGCPEYYIKYSGVTNLTSPDLKVCDTTPPSTPSLISPVDSASINTPSIDFDWSESVESFCASGFDHYVLYVDDDPAFGSPITRETSDSLVDGLLFTPGTWYWKVQFCDALDNCAETGTRSFERIISSDPLPSGIWTVITHGHPAGLTYQEHLDKWMIPVANSISALDPSNVIIHTMDQSSFAISPQNFDDTKHHILLFDWIETADICSELTGLPGGCNPISGDGQNGYAAAASESLYTFFRRWNIDDKVGFLVGYSRGAIVMSETARRLILAGTPPQQVMYIDGEGNGVLNLQFGGLQLVDFIDDRFDAWTSTPAVRWDNVYSTWDEFLVLLGGHNRPRCWNLNLGSAYSHSGDFKPENCPLGLCPPIILEVLQFVTFENGRYTLPGSWESPSETPLAPIDWFGSTHDIDQILFNGNFEWNSRAGWLEHGGNGSGHIDLLGEASYHVELDQNDEYLEHSWFWLRDEYTVLTFDYRISNADLIGCDDVFKVSLTPIEGQSHTWTVIPKCATTGWRSFSVSIPTTIRGVMCKLRLWKDPGPGGEIDSEVRVDNVTFIACVPPPAPTDALAILATICDGDLTTLTASSPNGEIDWFEDACGENYIDTGNSISVAPSESSQYYARVRDTATGCVSSTCDAVTVTVVGQTDCDDELFCNGLEECANGLCLSPGDPCPVDLFCNEDFDTCDDCLSDVHCDDGLFCNGAETCDANGVCQPGVVVDCNDGVSCTDDSCNEDTDSCDNIPDDGLCDNELWCDGSETCDPVTDCRLGAEPCIDLAHCDEVRDVCVCDDDIECDDGLFCNGAETCDASGVCQPGVVVDCNDGVSCTDDSCNEGTDSCDNIADDNLCDNGLFCDGAETCDASADCQSGTPPVIDDGVGCTDDSCDEVNDVVVNAPNDANCDNGLFCDGAEFCDVVADCQGAAPPGDPCFDLGLVCNEDIDGCDCTEDTDCDDGNPCTDDACPDLMCVYTNNTATCDDGAFCNGVEVCTDGACVSSGDPCANVPAACDDDVDGCVCDNDTKCDDGNICTDDVCAAGVCVNTDNAVSCNDGHSCTDSDTCSNGVCAGTVIPCCGNSDPCCGSSDPCCGSTDPCCGNSDPCCGSTDPCCGNPDLCCGVDCDDGDLCTTDTCDPLDGSCNYEAVVCPEGETCDPVTGDCVIKPAGIPCTTMSDCDDVNPCTEATCSSSGMCVFTPDDTNVCNDDVFCNGIEICNDGNCEQGLPPCTADEICEENANECKPDSDRDGIHNDDDACINSPDGCIPESDGCCSLILTLPDPIVVPPFLEYAEVCLFATATSEQSPVEGCIIVSRGELTEPALFDFWGGDVLESQKRENPLMLIMDSNKTITVEWQEIDGPVCNTMCGAGCGCTPEAPVVGLIFLGLLGMRFVGTGRRTCGKG